MEEIKQKLIKKAMERHGKIKPIGGRKSFDNPKSFTVAKGKISGKILIFWYDTDDDSTHIVIEDITERNGE